MSRDIAADSTEGWRAVTVFKRVDNQELVYHYEGIYAKPGTARGRVSFWKKHGRKAIVPDPKATYVWGLYYDGWIEKADIHWNREKD